MIFSLYKKITFDKYLLNMNTVVCKSPNKFIFLSSYIGSPVKSWRRHSGQTQRRLSGQSHTGSLVKPNAGSPVKSQCQVFGQIPVVFI